MRCLKLCFLGLATALELAVGDDQARSEAYDAGVSGAGPTCFADRGAPPSSGGLDPAGARASVPSARRLDLTSILLAVPLSIAPSLEADSQDSRLFRA
jgi:hypothetical protein